MLQIMEKTKTEPHDQRSRTRAELGRFLKEHRADLELVEMWFRHTTPVPLSFRVSTVALGLAVPCIAICYTICKTREQQEEERKRGSS